MHIDAFTLAAQIFNFMLLVFLLKKFLFGKIKAVMEERKNRLLKEAAENEKTAAELRERLNNTALLEKNLYQNRERLLEEARQKAKALEESLIKEAKNISSSIKTQWILNAENELKEYKKEICSLLVQIALSAAKKTLIEIAGERAEEKAVDLMLKKLAEKTNESLEFTNVLKKNKTALIVTDFKPDNEIIFKVKGALEKLTGGSITLEARQDASLIFGAMIKSGGKSIEWNAEVYLEDFDARLRRVFEDGKR